MGIGILSNVPGKWRIDIVGYFWKNIDKIYKEYGLDLGYYFSTPRVAMDLIIQISKEKISLITEGDQHLFFERSIWGRCIFNEDRMLKLT